MANTVDTLGDKALLRAILDGSLTEFKDEYVSIINNRKLYTMPELTIISAKQMTSIGDPAIRETPKLQILVFPKFTGLFPNGGVGGSTDLEIADLVVSGFKNYSHFYACGKLTKLILRKSESIASLADTNSFDGTPFASGGTGGTIYIPKVLYDELGTGTSLDYKAATNWSVIEGRGTITWAQIEGSEYEHYYADGTPIPTT